MSLHMPAAPAAAAVGKLTMLLPANPIRFNGSFTMTIDFANTETATIEDPDIALYLQAKNSGGTAQPLLPENVTITSPGIPVQKWNTGAGTQVGVKFFPDLHDNLAPGAHSTYIFTVGVAMPPGTASLVLVARAWKSGSPELIYDQKQGQVTVNAPTATPSPATSSPAPRPSDSTAPSTASATPVEPSPTPTESESPSAEPIDAVAVGAPSSTGLAWWIWLALFMIAASAGMLMWLVLRWRQDRALED
jgi:hypothetical protein